MTIPKGWVIEPLSKIGKFGKGKGLSGSSMTGNEFATENYSVPCIGYGDIYTKYDISFMSAKNFTDIESANESQKISTGTLLFTGTGETAEEIGKCVCYTGTEDIYAGGDIILFNSNNILPEYIAYQQYTSPLIRIKAQWGQGHSVVHIYKEQLEKLPCLHPINIDEQKNIIKILNSFHSAINLQTELLEKLKIQKKALLQKLLKPQDDWKNVKLGDILKERKTFRPKDSVIPHISLTMSGLRDKGDKYNRDFLVNNKNKKYKETRPNDICYNPANLKFGVIAKNDYGTAIFSPIYITFEVQNSYDPDFVISYLQQENTINQLLKYEQGTVYERMAVHPEDFIKFNAKFPSIKIQQEIGELIRKVDYKITIENQLLDKYKLQQKFLMENLLSGKIRVKGEAI